MKNTNPLRPSENKHYEGPHHGGEGVANLKQESKYEFMGVHRSGPNPKLSAEGGFTSQLDGREESGFDLNSKSYAGPQNWQPTTRAVRNPDDIDR